MRKVWTLAASLATACGTGEIPEQLEAIVVDTQSPALAGRVTVTGEDRDFAFTFDDDDGAVTIHSPTAAPLVALDGRDLTFETDYLEEDLWGNTTWRASDGAPVWLSYRSGPTELVDEWFGQGFATLGQQVGQERLEGEGIRRDHHAVRFQTDDGKIEVLPGTVDNLTIDGVIWRVGVVAAYHDEGIGDGGSKCGVSEDLLTYELLRVDAEVEPSELTRSSELEMARPMGGCG